MQQAAQQMLVDPPQPPHAHLLAELRKHPRARQLSPQPGEPAPGGLFGQLCHHQVEGVGGGEHRQQMHAPELGGTQAMPPATGEVTRTNSGDEVIRHITGKHFEQGDGADGRQRGSHDCTLTECAALATPLVSAQTAAHQPVANTFGTPSYRAWRFLGERKPRALLADSLCPGLLSVGLSALSGCEGGAAALVAEVTAGREVFSSPPFGLCILRP